MSVEQVLSGIRVVTHADQSSTQEIVIAMATIEGSINNVMITGFMGKALKTVREGVGETTSISGLVTATTWAEIAAVFEACKASGHHGNFLWLETALTKAFEASFPEDADAMHAVYDAVVKRIHDATEAQALNQVLEAAQRLGPGAAKRLLEAIKTAGPAGLDASKAQTVIDLVDAVATEAEKMS